MFDGFLNTPLAFAGKILESIEIKEHGHKWVENFRQIPRFLLEYFLVEFVTFFLKLYLIFKKIKVVALRCWFIQYINRFFS